MNVDLEVSMLLALNFTMVVAVDWEEDLRSDLVLIETEIEFWDLMGKVSDLMLGV